MSLCLVKIMGGAFFNLGAGLLCLLQSVSGIWVLPMNQLVWSNLVLAFLCLIPTGRTDGRRILMMLTREPNLLHAIYYGTAFHSISRLKPNERAWHRHIRDKLIKNSLRLDLTDFADSVAFDAYFREDSEEGSSTLDASRLLAAFCGARCQRQAVQRCLQPTNPLHRPNLKKINEN
jgi:hypothetical protein